jgi:hypothetical protein
MDNKYASARARAGKNIDFPREKRSKPIGPWTGLKNDTGDIL